MHNIQKYLCKKPYRINPHKKNKPHQILSTEIWDTLFPSMPPEVKTNAVYKIQLILGRAYSGN